MLDTVLAALPPAVRALVAALPSETLERLEEIRVREGRPLEISLGGEYAFVGDGGVLTGDPKQAYVPGRDDCRRLLELLTNHSVYTFEEELKRGYITVRGGHRVGLAGKTVLERGMVKQIRDVSGFNIRIAREIPGCAEPVLPKLYDPVSGKVHHTLIVSPPQQGKTTLLRDLARLLSRGGWRANGRAIAGCKVGIVDERSEIAACVNGVPTFDVGPRTDVLDGCPKAEGMMMMIRGMSPEVLVVDEIGREEDVKAVHEALHAGIRVIATAHGDDFRDVASRPMLKQLIEDRFFSRFVAMGRAYGIGRVVRIYDGGGRLTDSMIVGGGRRHG